MQTRSCSNIPVSSVLSRLGKIINNNFTCYDPLSVIGVNIPLVVMVRVQVFVKCFTIPGILNTFGARRGS